MKNVLGMMLCLVLVLPVIGCGGDDSSGGNGSVLTVTSASFAAGGVIPEQYCNNLNGHSGTNISPQLTWTGAPAGTITFVLIVDDSTAGNWSHWVLFDISAATTSLVEGYNSSVTDGIEGMVDGGVLGYEGPYPPSGNHTYHFTVYALDTTLGLGASSATRANVIAAMSGHILAEGETTGTHAFH